MSRLASGSADPDVIEVDLDSPDSATRALGRLDRGLSFFRPSLGVTVVDVVDLEGPVVVAVDPSGQEMRLSLRKYQSLREHVRHGEPGRLVDLMIIGAFVEARSCERFAMLAPHLDEELGRFYTFLLRSEARHFEYYLELAARYSPEPIDARVAHFRAIEGELIEAPDTEVRFHSGPLAA